MPDSETGWVRSGGRGHRIALQAEPGYLALFTVEPRFRLETGFHYGLRPLRTTFSRIVASLEMLQRDLEPRGIKGG